MTARLNPYLSWRGRAAEAMTFYQAVLGGELSSNTYADFGGMGAPEAEQDFLMHSQLVVSDGICLMGADTTSDHADDPVNGTVSLSGDDVEQVRGWFEGLAAGGTIDLPFEKAPWGDHFGQVTDRFGVTWMFNSGSAD